MSKKSISPESNDLSAKVVDINEFESRFRHELFVKPYQGSFFKRKIRPLFADNDEDMKARCVLTAMRRLHKAFATAGEIESLAHYFDADSKTMSTFQTVLAQCADHRDEVKTEKTIKKPLKLIKRPPSKLLVTHCRREF